MSNGCDYFNGLPTMILSKHGDSDNENDSDSDIGRVKKGQKGVKKGGKKKSERDPDR